MFCEAYNQSLKDAAASGEPPSPVLRQHLASCVACREVFAEEQSLFAAIESGLSVVANSEIPATFIPRIRVALNDEPAAQRHSYSFPFWGFASATVTAVVVFGLFHLLSKPPLVGPSQPSPVVTAQNPPERTYLNPVRTGGVSPVYRVKPVVQATRNNSRQDLLEVLVPPDEGAALLRYEKLLHGKSAAGIQTAAKSLDMPQGIEPLEIAELGLGDLKIPALPKPVLDGQAK